MRLRRTARRYHSRLLVLLVFNGFAQAIAAVGTALLVKSAFNKLIVNGGSALSRIAWLMGGGLLIAAAFRAWMCLAERTIAERLGQNYAHAVRLTLFDHLSSLTPRALQKRSRGGVLLRFVGDLTALRQWISLGLGRLIVASTTAVGVVLALAWINWRLAFGVGLFLSFGSLAAISLGGGLENTAREARRYRTRLAANVSERLASPAVVQMFGQIEREKKRMKRQSLQLQDAMIRRAGVAGRLRGVVELTVALATAAALLVGAHEVSARNISAGTVVAAMTIVGLLAPSLRDLGRVKEYWHNSRVALEKIENFLATPTLVPEARDASPLQASAGRLEFIDVNIEDVLKDFSAVAEPGKVTAILGPNGAGKSTLLALAARLIDPDNGSVTVDGQDLAKHTLDSVRHCIGMAGPDLPLLRGTIEKNLLYRCPESTEEEIKRVRRLCGMDELLDILPEGDKTRIAEEGQGLSTGQRQRIALARAILGNPPLLLLDEVDANLDAQSAAVIDHVLSQYKGTVLLVTHRIERMERADGIWFLEAGRLVESGSPQKLLNSDGPTARFIRGSNLKS